MPTGTSNSSASANTGSHSGAPGAMPTFCVQISPIIATSPPSMLARSSLRLSAAGSLDGSAGVKSPGAALRHWLTAEISPISTPVMLKRLIMSRLSLRRASSDSGGRNGLGQSSSSRCSISSRDGSMAGKVFHWSPGQNSRFCPKASTGMACMCMSMIGPCCCPCKGRIILHSARTVSMAMKCSLIRPRKVQKFGPPRPWMPRASAATRSQRADYRRPTLGTLRGADVQGLGSIVLYRSPSAAFFAAASRARSPARTLAIE